MSPIKGLVWGVLLLAATVLGIGLILPGSATVTREIEIAAPPEAVFEVLDGFEHFTAWSPWAGLDPETRYVSSGPTRGVGAAHAWFSDNPQIGEGQQEILESEPYQRIVVRVGFSGFAAENRSLYTLAPTATGTHLVWQYQTTVGNDLLGRYFLLLLDRMLGPQYERGLVALKQFIESSPPDAAPMTGGDIPGG